MAGEPIPCEYETPEGRACPNRARIRLTFVQPEAKGISGEPVKFFTHACYGHLERAKATARLVVGIELETTEAL